MAAQCEDIDEGSQKRYPGYRVSYSQSNLSARRAILSALDDEHVGEVRFTLFGYEVQPAYFTAVRVLVELSRISVRCDFTSSDCAYEPAKNRFTLNFDKADTSLRKGLIIHEALHAWFDARRSRRMQTATSEALSYVAQCMHIRARTTDPSLRLMGSADTDRIFELAWSLAGDALAKRMLRPDTGNALLRAITTSQKYRHIANKGPFKDSLVISARIRRRWRGAKPQLYRAYYKVSQQSQRRRKPT